MHLLFQTHLFSGQIIQTNINERVSVKQYGSVGPWGIVLKSSIDTWYIEFLHFKPPLEQLRHILSAEISHDRNSNVMYDQIIDTFCKFF